MVMKGISEEVVKVMMMALIAGAVLVVIVCFVGKAHGGVWKVTDRSTSVWKVTDVKPLPCGKSSCKCGCADGDVCVCAQVRKVKKVKKVRKTPSPVRTFYTAPRTVPVYRTVPAPYFPSYGVPGASWGGFRGGYGVPMSYPMMGGGCPGGSCGSR